MSPAERKPLPTKEQIQAIDDAAILVEIRDDIEHQIVKIETDLEFRTDDHDWASRARSALSHHRQARRHVDRRIAILKEAEHKASIRAPIRPQQDTNPLTLEVLASKPEIDPGTIQTAEGVDGVMGWLAARIEAVTDDRTDEIGLPSWERDEGFLARTGSLLRAMRGMRQALQTRRGQITKAQRPAPKPFTDQSREQLFIDAAREVLDRETFLAVWARVDQIEETGLAA